MLGSKIGLKVKCLISDIYMSVDGSLCFLFCVVVEILVFINLLPCVLCGHLLCTVVEIFVLFK